MSPSPSNPPHQGLAVRPEVAEALAEGRAVVALESSIIAHGMPYPTNVQTARSVEAIIRDRGVVPATIAVLGGRCVIGVDDAGLALLATKSDVRKMSVRDLPHVVATRGNGATTVASTMRLAALAGIAVFATGGIGGVHRGAAATFDVSADLTELSLSDVAVVSAGVKSVLDVGLTLEYLETLGVPVVGFGTDDFPSFYSRSSGFPAPLRLDDAHGIARLMRAKWDLGLRGGIVVANPIPAAGEIPTDEMAAYIERALGDLREQRITGREVTPFLLARVGELSGGSSLRANIALVEHNAAVAADIAFAFAAAGGRAAD